MHKLDEIVNKFRTLAQQQPEKQQIMALQRALNKVHKLLLYNTRVIDLDPALKPLKSHSDQLIRMAGLKEDGVIGSLTLGMAKLISNLGKAFGNIYSQLPQDAKKKIVSIIIWIK